MPSSSLPCVSDDVRQIPSKYSCPKLPVRGSPFSCFLLVSSPETMQATGRAAAALFLPAPDGVFM